MATLQVSRNSRTHDSQVADLAHAPWSRGARNLRLGSRYLDVSRGAYERGKSSVVDQIMPGAWWAAFAS